MRVRFKEKPDITGDSDEFNIHSIAEVIVTFDDGSKDTMYPWDLEVEINGEWKSLHHGFQTKQILPNNHNTHFKLASECTEEERIHGWYD